jgi:hypothetical protein
VELAISATLQELQRLGYTFQKNLSPDQPSIWWNDHHNSSPIETQGQQ